MALSEHQRKQINKLGLVQFIESHIASLGEGQLVLAHGVLPVYCQDCDEIKAKLGEIKPPLEYRERQQLGEEIEFFSYLTRSWPFSS